MRFRLIGSVQVDSGMVVILDPGYLKDVDAKHLFNIVCERMDKAYASEFVIPYADYGNSFDVKCVASDTGGCDGTYPVYA